MQLTREQLLVLKEAHEMIAEVQIELKKTEDKKPKTDQDYRWEWLYQARVKINDFIYTFSPESGYK